MTNGGFGTCHFGSLVTILDVAVLRSYCTDKVQMYLRSKFRNLEFPGLRRSIFNFRLVSNEYEALSWAVISKVTVEMTRQTENELRFHI